jgi:hypothetical protein
MSTPHACVIEKTSPISILDVIPSVVALCKMFHYYFN